MESEEALLNGAEYAYQRCCCHRPESTACQPYWTRYLAIDLHTTVEPNPAGAFIGLQMQFPEAHGWCTH